MLTIKTYVFNLSSAMFFISNLSASGDFLLDLIRAVNAAAILLNGFFSKY